MAKEEAFYADLASYAGKETNAKHLFFILALAMQFASGLYPINLSKHVEALVDDAETIREARQSLERISIRQKKENSPGRIILS